MPLISMRPLLKQAQAGKYGVAAYNMIDYNSARSIIEGAAQLDAPVIVQVSVKTVKHWGLQAGRELGARAGRHRRYSRRASSRPLQ